MNIRFALVIASVVQLLAVAAHAACPPVPDTSFRFSRKAGFGYQRSADPTKDKLQFTYGNGASTTAAELGSPTTTDGYDLCVYAGSVLVGTMAAGADGDCNDGACWKTKTTSVAFGDKTGAAGGLNAIKVGVAKDGSAKTTASAKGKGANLPDLTVPLVEPIVVQLRNTLGTCWGAIFSGPAQVVQDAAKGKVKTKLSAKTLPTCADGVRNAFESDVDCGGSCGATCGVGASCGADVDCASGLCSAAHCAFDPATTTVVTDNATTIPSGPAPKVSGEPITFTATVANAAGTPTGTIQWSTSYGACADTPLVGGVATCTITPPAAYLDEFGNEVTFLGPYGAAATFVPMPGNGFAASSGADSTGKIAYSGYWPAPQNPFIIFTGGCYIDITVLGAADALGRTMDFNWLLPPGTDVRATTNPTYEWEAWPGIWTWALDSICPHGVDPSVSYECNRPHEYWTFKNETSPQTCPWGP